MLICFDYDGVIADTFDDLLLLCQESWREVGGGRCPVADDFRTAKNLTFTSVAEQLGIPNDRVEAYGTSVLSKLAAGGIDTVFEAIPSVLRRLAENHTLCVVTANTERKVAMTLEDAGISECFSTILGGDAGLPKSEQIAQVCTELGYSRADTVMVGDTRGDVRMATVADVTSVAVLWGYQDRDTLALESPDHLIERPEELATLVESLSQEKATR
jgi:phosphoglycolate phosphatase